MTPLVEDLARVPEIGFQQPLARDMPLEKAQEQTALTIARINHLNQTKSDHFLEALLETRADLAGLTGSDGRGVSHHRGAQPGIQARRFNGAAGA